MRAISLAFLCIMSLGAVSVSAERPSSAHTVPANAVQDYFQNCIGHAYVSGTVLAGIESINTGRPGSGEYERIFAEARACVEAKFQPALDAAAGDADLIDALKAYHEGVLIWIKEASHLEESQEAYRAKNARIKSDFDPLRQKLQQALSDHLCKRDFECGRKL